MANALDDLNDPYAPPVSAGKLKALWDAVRTLPPPPQAAPAGGTGDATATAGSQPTPVQQQLVAGGYTPPSSLAAGPLPGTNPDPGSTLGAAIANQRIAGMQGAAPVAAPGQMGPGPVPAVVDDSLSAGPNVHMASPNMADMPGSPRVDAMQHQVDLSNQPATLTQKLLGFAPVAAAALLGKFGGGQAGSFAQGVPIAQEQAREQQNLNRTNLTTQLAAAEQERGKEFDTAQRTQELANAATENNRTRDIVARTLAGSRTDVAGINAGAKRDVAASTVTGRGNVADIAANARIRAAQIAAEAREVSGRYAADAAANRQTRSLSAAASRQSAGFNHTDTKPTADEDRRADLSMSLGHILDDIEERTGRRPELIGPLAGRATQLAGTIGTNDEDIASLNADREAMGQLMLGAHAMKNAGHIETAGNSVINAFHNGPEAMKAAIEQARKNANTMTTITRPTLAARTAPSSSSPSSPKPKPTAKGELTYTPGKGIH